MHIATPDHWHAIIPGYKAKGGITADFLHCVTTREKPFRDIELAVNTMALCHLGTIAYRLKRSLKWDAAKCLFTGDDEAIAWIRREGKGRMFFNSLGHDVNVFHVAGVLKFNLDGIQYALGDLPADDSPGTP